MIASPTVWFFSASASGIAIPNFFLDRHDQLDDIQAVCHEIINEMGVGHYFLAVGAKLMRHEIADPMATSPQATLPRSGLVLCAQPVPQGLHAEPDSSGGQ